MKRIVLSITVCVLAVLVLASCGAKQQESTASTESTPKAEATAAAEPTAAPTAEPTPAPEDEALPTPAPENVTHYSSLPAPETGSDAFVEEFMTNPIDAQYDADMDDAASGSAMIDACNTAMESWKKQIDSVYMQILNTADEKKAAEVKKAQEEWVNNQNDQLREIRENIDEEDAMAAVTAAENIMLYYRSRAIDLCVILYEIDGQIVFG